MQTKFRVFLLLSALGASSAFGQLAVDHAGGATAVGAFGATLNARVSGSGGDDPQLVIFWGATDGGTSAASWAAAEIFGAVGDGEYFVPVVGLAQGTPYYYRAWVSNAAGQAWASASSSFTTRTSVVSARSLMIGPTNGAIVNAPDFAAANRLHDYDTGDSTFLRRDGKHPASSLQVRSLSGVSNVIVNGAFYGDGGWLFVGNGQYNNGLSRGQFLPGNFGRIAQVLPIPVGTYELRIKTIASNTNTILISTGFATYQMHVPSGTHTTTNIIIVGGSLAFEATPPSDIIGIDDVALLTLPGGPISGGPAAFESLVVRARPRVMETDVALLSDLDELAEESAAGFVVKVGSVVLYDQDLSGPWTPVLGGAWTNAEGWWTTATPTTNGLLAADNAVVVSPLLTNGYIYGTYAGATPRSLVEFPEIVAENSTNLLDWSEAMRTADASYFRLNFRSKLALPTDEVFDGVLSKITIYGWEFPQYALKTQDVSGTSIRVAPAVAPDEPVQKSQLDAPVAALNVRVDNWSQNRAVSVIRDGGHGVAVGDYWFVRADEIYRVEFGGNSVFELYYGSAASPQILGFSMAPTSLSLVVRGTANYAVTPFWSTNGNDWVAFSTNEFHSTFPVLSNNTYTLTVPFVASNRYIWYRAESASGSSNDSGARFRVPVSAPNLWYFSTAIPSNSLAAAKPRTIVAAATNVWLCVDENFLGPGTNWLKLTGTVVTP